MLKGTMKIFIGIAAFFAVAMAFSCPDNQPVKDYCTCQILSFGLLIKCDLVDGDFQQLMDSIKNTTGPILLKFRNAHIEDLSADMFDATEICQLSFDHSHIENIHKGALGSMKQLELLRFNDSIAEIPDFTNASHLRTLEISYHYIRALRNGDFVGLENLATLRIRRGNIAEIESDTFMPLVNMRSLYLSHNHLQTLPDVLVAENSKLEFIYLSHNHLLEFPGTALVNAADIISVDLTSNRLKKITEGSFLSLLSKHRLHRIRLTDNPIRCDPSLCWMKNEHGNRRFVSAFSGSCINHDQASFRPDITSFNLYIYVVVTPICVDESE